MSSLSRQACKKWLADSLVISGGIESDLAAEDCRLDTSARTEAINVPIVGNIQVASPDR